MISPLERQLGELARGLAAGIAAAFLASPLHELDEVLARPRRPARRRRARRPPEPVAQTRAKKKRAPAPRVRGASVLFGARPRVRGFDEEE